MIDIIPVNDREEHEEGLHCKCHPVLIVIEEGENIILHRAFDCRELLENINLN